MDTKLSQLRAALDAGDTVRAVAIAARFPRLGAIRNAVLDAQMAITNPAFVRGIKKDPDALVSAGVAALISTYKTPRS